MTTTTDTPPNGTTTPPALPTMDDLYRRLSQRFAQTRFREGPGRVRLEYIDGEQCINRANQVLGINGWSHRVLEHGLTPDGSEYWALVQVTVYLDGREIIHEHIGNKKMARNRTSGAYVNYGFDMKSAITDGIKKAFTALGIALYLYNHDEGTDDDEEALVSVPPCSVCQEPLVEARFKNGTVWSPAEVAEKSLERFGKVLCITHIRAATDAES